MEVGYDVTKGSSIKLKDVRKEGEGGQARVDAHKKILKKVSKKT